MLSARGAPRSTSYEARVQDLEQHLAAVAEQVGALQEAVPVDDHRGDAPAQRCRAARSNAAWQGGMHGQASQAAGISKGALYRRVRREGDRRGAV